MRSEEKSRLPSKKIAVLGVITITVYGSWYYSFGVLLDPIIADTGWSEPLLASAFSASLLIGGVGSLGGGWLLDRFGSRAVFTLAAFVGAIAFQAGSFATSAFVFAVAVAIGGGTFSALGFYHVTQTVAVRVSPGWTTKAIATLTIWGAFAGAIFLPLSGWLVTRVDWRPTLRLLTVSAVISLVVGAIILDTRPRTAPVGRPRIIGELAEALKDSRTRSFVVAVAMVGIGIQTMLAYQVPAMTAAGLSIGAASFWAGSRSLGQLLGRLPLMAIIARLGTTGSLRLAIGAIGAGGLVLAIAGTPIVAATYAAVAGFGIGALSPLQGMYARDVFGSDSLGTAMGLLSFVFLAVGSVGPVTAGVVSATTGSRAIAVAGGAVIAAVAALLIRDPVEFS